MIHNIIFDLGGVVVGRDYDLYGHEIAEFSFLMGDRPFPEYWKRYNLGVSNREEVVKALSEESGLTEGQASAKVDRLMRLFYQFPDTAELITELSAAGYKLYVLSNMPREFYEYISEFPVFKYFDGLIISSDEKLAKPDPAIFKLTAERFGIKPEESLFVDDRGSNIRAAESLSFNVCHFVPKGNSCDEIRRILSKHR